ncbi:NTP transferase domain-containing protein [Candidatus Bathyarchaeota archaeon]|nr:NTP transferase domain-containing protein [Candidatus Bathyarchaeota archaeon]
MKAVVLAAGEGIRLRPLTSTRPKHLIPVGGKPLLEHLLSSIKAAGVDEALIVVYYMADRIQQFFGDGSKFGMKLEYVLQAGVRGTADATGLAKDYVKEDFLLVYGDLFITPDVIKQVVRSHEKEKPAATMAVAPVKHPEQYGIVKLDGSYITDIVEKPSPAKAPTNLANAGIYVLSPEIFEEIRKTRSSSRHERELTDSLRLLMQKKKQVHAVQVSSDEWLDVGRPWDLLEANRRSLNQMKPANRGRVEDGAHLVGIVSVAKGALVRSGAYIQGPAFIGESSDIGPNCFIRPYTSVGTDVKIGNACEIKNSIIMDKTRIRHLSYVGDSVIGENCNLGAGSIVANYRLDSKTIKMGIKGEIVSSERTKLGVFLGDGVKTGINTLLMPGVTIGRDSWIGPNLIVYRDVPSNAFLLLKQEVEEHKT